MEKTIRKAVRCYVIKNDNVLTIKYKSGNKKDFFDIPGGKIEKGESAEQAVVREMKEETGTKVKEIVYKGNMIIEYPNKIFDLDIFVANESEGEPEEFEENTSEWIEINKLLQKEKILSNIMILDRFFIRCLIEDSYNFKMHVIVDEEEKVLDVKYNLERIEKNK